MGDKEIAYKFNIRADLNTFICSKSFHGSMIVFISITRNKIMIFLNKLKNCPMQLQKIRKNGTNWIQGNDRITIMHTQYFCLLFKKI